MKKVTDYSQFKNVLPYASEIFGVYQPLLGWKSKRIQQRIAKAFHIDRARIHDLMFRKFRGKFEAVLNPDQSLQGVRSILPAVADTAKPRPSGSFVLDSIAKNLPPLLAYNDAIWDKLLVPDDLAKTLSTVVVQQTLEWYKGALAQQRTGATNPLVPRPTVPPVSIPSGQPKPEEVLNGLVADQLNRESAVSGYLLYLKENNHVDVLHDLFYKPDTQFSQLMELLAFHDPLEMMDPFKDIARAGLSPIGIVHLFRQYFYEFDTFLGSPVSHVWLSPGSTVELVEINTRRTLVERTIENALETTSKSEKSMTDEDELSDAVKTSNQSDTKFGMNATVNQGWIGGSASASASINMGSTQSQARETTHKHMRQQSEKLSTEIRKNFKSTFKTVTETVNTSSKRYVLNNSTPSLLNYELRRKMRQVGVQVQDVGTYLCWQTYVDNPGKQLGIAKLVHIAKDPETGGAPPPEAIPMPPAVPTTLSIDIPFVQTSEDRGDLDEAYRNGNEVDTDLNEGDIETIQSNFPGQIAICDHANYQFSAMTFDYQGHDIQLGYYDLDTSTVGRIKFGVHVKYVNFHNASPIRVTANIIWEPTKEYIDKVNAENAAKVKDFNEATQREFEKAFVDAARDRITKSSKIQSRKFEDLREEERIVVYRGLIQEMLTKNLPMPDDRTRHVVSELLNTIFDIDKMLYFVAPEWWRPRLHHSHQGLGGIRPPVAITAGSASVGTVYEQVQGNLAKQTFTRLGVGDGQQVAAVDTVSWGGSNESSRDNYYITEDSDPAKLGSSLGWLLQLDGDNMRNAFLNAPWVKAVIPVRPGKERAAMNWLQRLHVEGTDGLDDPYVAPANELAEIAHSGAAVSVRDAINHLCDVVAKKHDDSMKVQRFPDDEINDDNKVSATPIDKVYEHGFYPLQGGFRLNGGSDFEIFDQWIEILPTDQVVPVEVTYDPKTGRQI